MSLDETGTGSMSKSSTRSGRESRPRNVVEPLARVAGGRGDTDAGALDDPLPDPST